MKRKDIVASLMIEGFSEKTLVTLSDKELSILAKRVLSEQVPTPPMAGGNTTSVTNVSRTDIATQNALKQQKKPFATYEGEMTEDKDKDDEKKLETIKKIKYKIKHEKDEKKIKALKSLLKRMEEKEKEGISLNEWVDQVVSKNVHPFTSKNEIMSLIKSKLHEQEVAEPEVDVEALPDWLTYDAIMAAGAPSPAEPTTRPTTRPGKPDQRPTPKTPYKPGPGPNTRPKAEKK